ncbi:MAG: polysaccharide pyruvyl transferase family protein, partial [Alphaproteobacteria bacterium]|nr:polysaccharide pyruvyl transferase family protein [Alphaproteobacteria bacterium]
VRGLQTEAWLRKNGFTNARAIGCPSMYVYPKSIISIDPQAAIEAHDRANVLTAGYLTVEGGRNYARGQKLAKALQGTRSSYVFQDEFFAYGSMIEEHGSFDDATCMGDRDRLNALLTRSMKVPVNVSNYYYFSETAAWRQVAFMHDFYIGDRFHGGVAALQVGRPAIFLSHDNRVAPTSLTSPA